MIQVSVHYVCGIVVSSIINKIVIVERKSKDVYEVAYAILMYFVEIIFQGVVIFN